MIARSHAAARPARARPAADPRRHCCGADGLNSRQAPAPSTHDAETCIALANELARAVAALVCAARGSTGRFGKRDYFEMPGSAKRHSLK